MIGEKKRETEKGKGKKGRRVARKHLLNCDYDAGPEVCYVGHARQLELRAIATKEGPGDSDGDGRYAMAVDLNDFSVGSG